MTRPVRRGFQLTAAGQLLRRDVAGSLAPALEWIADPLHLTLYSNLRHSVETGDTTFDAVYGEPFFDWSTRQENAEEAAVFNNAMTSISEMFIPAFLDAYPIGSFSKIVDVGGGHGAVLRAILKQNPNLSGTLAEMPSLLADAQAAIANDALADRCQAVPCNFFESVPAGGDLYFMKHIVHDWSDEQALRLLKNIRSVIPANGTLLLAEAVLDDSPAPHPGKLIDIEMIAFVGGKERTAARIPRTPRCMPDSHCKGLSPPVLVFAGGSGSLLVAPIAHRLRNLGSRERSELNWRDGGPCVRFRSAPVDAGTSVCNLNDALLDGNSDRFRAVEKPLICSSRTSGGF